MAKYSTAAIESLSRRLEVDHGFFMECLHESVIELHETEGRLDLGEGTVLQLRRLERLCHTFQIDVPTAAQLLALTRRVAELEQQVRLLSSRLESD